MCAAIDSESIDRSEGLLSDCHSNVGLGALNGLMIRPYRAVSFEQMSRMGIREDCARVLSNRVFHVIPSPHEVETPRVYARVTDPRALLIIQEMACQSMLRWRYSSEEDQGSIRGRTVLVELQDWRIGLFEGLPREKTKQLGYRFWLAVSVDRQECRAYTHPFFTHEQVDEDLVYALAQNAMEHLWLTHGFLGDDVSGSA